MPKIWTIERWYGGLSTGSKLGIAGSFASGIGLDIKTDPDVLSVNNRAAQNDGGIVTSLPKWIKRFDTGTFFYGNNGSLFLRTSAGTWSIDRNVAASAGQGLEVFNDTLYYARTAFLGSRTTAGVYNDSVVALNSDSDWHPLKQFLTFLAVGNGNTLSTLSTGNVLTNRFSLPTGLKIKSLEVVGDLLAIGAWRGTNITDFEEGHLFFWDGFASTYLSHIPFNESGVNALLYDDNNLIVFAGTRGNFYASDGTNVVKIKRLPNIGSSYADIWPGAITRWNGATHFGVAGETGSSTLIQGVYSWGRVEKNYPEVLNLEYPISSGTTTGTTLRIGAIGELSPTQLFIGWDDNSSFGVDLISTTTPYASTTYESLIFNGNNPYQMKMFNLFKLNFAPLPSNTSITLAYRADRASSYTNIGSVSGDGSVVEARFSTHIRAYEIQLRLTLAVSSGNSAPEITSLAVIYEDTDRI